MQHVFGQREHDRAGPPGHRSRIRARDIFGDALRIVDPRRPFARRAEESGEVELLKSFPIAHAARHIAHEQDHRLRILHGDMDADAGIGRTRTARDEADTGPPSHRAIGTGHESRAPFLAAGNDVDRGLPMQRVEHGKEAFPRNGEYPVAALFDQAIDEQACSGGRGNGGFGHGAALPRPFGAGNRWRDRHGLPAG